MFGQVIYFQRARYTKLLIPPGGAHSQTLPGLFAGTQLPSWSLRGEYRGPEFWKTHAQIAAHCATRTSAEFASDGPTVSSIIGVICATIGPSLEAISCRSRG